MAGNQHAHVASRHFPNKPDRQGAGHVQRINSAYRPYGAIAYGAIGTGTFLGGAGGGPGQPQGVTTAGGVSNGYGSQQASTSAMDHLSPDQFGSPQAGDGPAVDNSGATGSAPDATSGSVAQ